MLAMKLDPMTTPDEFCLGSGQVLGSASLSGAWNGCIEIRMDEGLSRQATAAMLIATRGHCGRGRRTRRHKGNHQPDCRRDQVVLAASVRDDSSRCSGNSPTLLWCDARPALGGSRIPPRCGRDHGQCVDAGLMRRERHETRGWPLGSSGLYPCQETRLALSSQVSCASCPRHFLPFPYCIFTRSPTMLGNGIQPHSLSDL